MPRAPTPAFPLSHYEMCLSPSLTGLSRNVYYFFDDLLAISRGVATVCHSGPIRPATHILFTSPPNLAAPKPLSTHLLALRLRDRWLAPKIIVIWVATHNKRKLSHTANESPGVSTVVGEQ